MRATWAGTWGGMLAGVLVAGGALAGCSVSADYGGTAYACDESMACPGGQMCQAGRCVDDGSGVDARPGQIDGALGVDGAGAPDAAIADASSCRELYQLGERDDGVYSIKPLTPPRSPRDVYCNMTVAGGGWTLVGRSAEGGAGSFGWRQDAGSPSNGATPHSVDARIVGDFSEILVATRADVGLGVGDFAVTIAMPNNFVAAYATTGTGSLTLTPVTGTCDPLGTPLALTHAGFTTGNDRFLFSVTGLDSNTGLEPDGFDFTSGDCSVPLSGRQGMLFVR